jgi:hypothetical protein
VHLNAPFSASTHKEDRHNSHFGDMPDGSGPSSHYLDVCKSFGAHTIGIPVDGNEHVYVSPYVLYYGRTLKFWLDVCEFLIMCVCTILFFFIAVACLKYTAPEKKSATIPHQVSVCLGICLYNVLISCKIMPATLEYCMRIIRTKTNHLHTRLHND